MSTRQTLSFTYSIVACLVLVGQAPLASEAPESSSPVAQPSVSDGAERDAASPPGCVPGWAIDAAGIRRLPDRCFAEYREMPGPVESVVLVSPGCAPPWFIDSSGIKRLKMACLGLEPARAEAAVPAAPASAAPTEGCEPPWFVDSSGIQRLKMACLGLEPARAEAAVPASPASAAPVEGCEPPWFVDSSGIQRLRPRCL